MAVSAPARKSESASPEHPDPAQQTPLRRALIASIVMVFLDIRVVAALLPPIALSFQVSIPRAGLLISSYMLAYGVFQLFYAPFADRFGKVRVVVVAMVVFSAGTFACGLTSNFTVMVALRALTGAAGAAVFPMTLAYVGDTVPYKHRQATVAMLLAGAAAGNTLSTASGSLIAEAFSWRWVFPVFGAVAGVVTLLLLVTSRLEHRVPPSQVPALKTYGVALKNPALLRLMPLAFVHGALYFGYFSYIAGFFDERLDLSTLGIGIALTLAGAAQLFSSMYLLQRALKRFSESAILTLGGGVMALGVCLSAILPSWPLQVAAMVIGSGGFNFVHSTLQTRASETLPKMRATAISFFAVSVFSGSGVGTLLIGALLPSAGYEATLFGVGVCMWIMIMVARRMRTPGAAA